MHRPCRHLLGACLIALAACAGPTWARAADAPPPLLLYGVEGPDPVLGERALASFNVQTRARGAPRVRHVSTVLSHVPVFEVTGGEERTCHGSPVTLAAFRETQEEAFTHVQYVRVDAAKATLEQLEGLIPCLAEVLPRDELARIAFLDGVAWAYDGHDDDARESFRRALLVAPELSWEPRFPPDPESLFREAAMEALRSPTTELHVSPVALGGATLWVDGVAYPSAGGDTTLAVGEHLVQWQLEDGTFATRVLAVSGDQPLRVRSKGDVAVTILRGADSAASMELATASLIRAAEDAGVGEVYLAELGEVDRIHRFVVAEERWELADEGTVARRLRDHRTRRSGRIALLAGGLTASAGLLLGGLGHARAQQLLAEAPSHQSTEEFQNASKRYANNRTQAVIGFGLAGLGGAAATAGLVITTRGGGSPGIGAGPPPGIQLQLAPGSLGLRGTFR